METRSSSNRTMNNKMSKTETLNKVTTTKRKRGRRRKPKNNVETTTTTTDSLPYLPPEMLLKIFKRLPTKDLFACRLVCLHWNRTSTSLYRLRPDNIKELTFVSEKIGYTMKKMHSSEDSLSSFLAVIKSYMRIPSLGNLDNFLFSRFHLHVPFILSTDLEEFFTLYGPFIKYLNVECQHFNMHKKETVQSLYQLLFNYTPNLQELELDKYLCASKSLLFLQKVEEEEEEAEENNQVTQNETKLIMKKLNKIKILTVDIDCSFKGALLLNILNATTHLQQIKLPNNTLLNYRQINRLASLEKLHVVKEALLELTGENVNSILSSVNHGTGLKLNILTINTEIVYNFNDNELWKKTSIMINKILIDSRDSLERLDIINPLGFLTLLKIPKLNKLKILNLSPWYGSFTAAIFPQDFDPNDSFPNLTIVNCALSIMRNEEWARLFPKNISMKTVTTLRLNYCSTAPILGQLSELFPNVLNLYIDFRIKHFPMVGRRIWLFFPQLEKLKLNIDVHHHNNRQFALDATFTGFTEEKCQQLSEISLQALKTFSLEEMETYRANQPSILLLKNLRILQVTLLANTKIQSPPWEWGRLPLFSKISRVFAFQLMKKLQVKIKVVKNNSKTHDSD